MIPNAGLQHVAPIAEFGEERWDELLAVLLTSPFLLAKYSWPALPDERRRPDRRDRLRPRSGCLALQGRGMSPRSTACSGSSKTLALEGAADGISVGAVCPGYVRTPLVESQVAAQAQAHGIPEERVLEDVILAPQARRELIEPAQVADAVAWLLGPAGRFATGSPLLLDGGWLAR